MTSTSSDDDLDSIYSALRHNMGRERVTDANVGALIKRAQADGEVQLEYLLREWRSPCGDDPAMPDLADVQGVPPAAAPHSTGGAA